MHRKLDQRKEPLNFPGKGPDYSVGIQTSTDPLDDIKKGMPLHTMSEFTDDPKAN